MSDQPSPEPITSALSPETWRIDGPFDPVLAGKLMGKLGHPGFLDLAYGGHGPDWFEAVLPWREDLVGFGQMDVLASGPVISLFDTATAMAIWTRRGASSPSHARPADRLCARGSARTRVVARAECYQVRGDLSFVRALAHDGDIADPLAHATAIFMSTGEGE
jgi:acyl-coenzyme A thioesterase PaaI-like protein